MARTDQIDLSDVDELLAPEELTRSARFGTPLLRDRWLASRVLLRRLLGERLGCAPAAVPLGRTLAGKPIIVPALTESLDFSLSHSDDLMLIAMTSDGQIGADIECYGHPGTDEPVWETLCTREAEWVSAQADPYHAFLRLWTRKEAIVKALGSGLPDALPALDVLWEPVESSASVSTPWGGPLHVIDLPAPAGCCAALAVTHPPTTLDVLLPEMLPLAPGPAR